MNYEKEYKKLKADIEKAYLFAQTDSTKAVLEHILPELRESEDERIRKELISFLQLPHPQFVGERKQEKWVDWLEKQKLGQQEEPQVYEIEDGKAITYSESEGYKVVEPKFKVGDWVVVSSDADETIHQISKIGHFKSGNPQYWTTEGKWFGNNYQVRLWNIKDAKDGDILYSPEHNLLWIYMDKEQYHASINLNYANFVSFGADIVIPKDTCPATKKQRDLLFRKMKESGYEWDGENKKLKHID